MTDKRKDETILKPCPFCGGNAEFMLEGTQPDITCDDCGISYSIQASDHFTQDERYNDAGFAFIMEPHYCYAEKGKQRAKEVLTDFWNTRADLSPPVPDDVASAIDSIKRELDMTHHMETVGSDCIHVTRDDCETLIRYAQEKK